MRIAKILLQYLSVTWQNHEEDGTPAMNLPTQFQAQRQRVQFKTLRRNSVQNSHDASNKSTNLKRAIPNSDDQHNQIDAIVELSART